jgi:hypothetical protein
LGLVSLLLVVWRLPRELKGVAVDLKTWCKMARNRPASSWWSPSSIRF